METGVVTIQEPVSSKINIEEAPAGVILDHSSMKVDKVNLSTVLDDEITSRDCGNNTFPGEADGVNGSGSKETEESECEKGEAIKTISVVEDCKIVKEKASETEKDEQGSIFVQEPESFNKNIEDANINLSDMTLEKEKEDNIIEKPEEISVKKAVIEEDQTETKLSPEQEEEIGNISKVLIDTTPVKVDENAIEKSLNSAREEIPIKTDEVKEEATVETSVYGTEAEHNSTVSVEEISRNGENITNETVPEEETATDGVETTKRVLEVKKEEEEVEMKTDAEPLIKTVVEEASIVSNEETTAHESETLKENVEPVEAIKNSDDAEQISSEVTVDKEKEEVITQNTEEVQESVRVIETPTIQGEDIESKDTEKHEHMLVRDIPQGETLVTEAETVDTSTVQEGEILKTNVNETEAHSATGGEEEGQETKENTKLSQDLKEDKEQEETEMVKTIISSDEVKSSDVQVKEFGEHTKPRSLEIIDESHGKEESVEVKSKETVKDDITEEKHENLQDVASTESEKYQDIEPETSIVSNSEKFEDIPSDLVLNVDKEELKDQVDGSQIMEEQRGLDSNGAEAEQIDRNRTDETEESPVAKLVTLPDVESVEQIQKTSLESSSEVSDETSKTIDENIEEKPEEETVSVPESKELGEQAHEESTLIDQTPLQEESCLLNKQEKVTKLEEHETTNEEVIEVSTVVQAKTIENIKENEQEQAADKILKSLETVETVESHSSLPSSSEEQQHGTVSEMIEDEKFKEEEPMVQIKSEEDTAKNHEKQEESSKTGETTVVQAAQTRDIGPFLTEKEEEEEAEMKTDAEPRLDETEKEEIETVKTVEEDAKIVNSEETTAHESQSLKGDDHHDENAELVEAIKNSDDAEQNSREVTVDKETQEDITLKTEKVQESSKAIEKPTIQEEDIESKASLELKEEVDQSSKDIEEHEHVLGRDLSQCETLEVETVEAKEDTKPSLEKEDKEQEVTETAKSVIFSDEVRPYDQVDVQAEELDEHTEPCSSKIKDESHGRKESVEVKTKETVKDKSIEENHENLLDVPSTESEKYQDNEPETSIVTNTEIREIEKEKLKDEKMYVDQVDGTQIMEEQRGLDSNGAEAEQVDQNRADETEESPVAKLVALPDVESVEQMQKPSLDSPSEVSEETSKTIDEKIEEKSEEETVLVQESKELGEQADEERTLIELTHLQEESSQPNEQEKETKLEKHEPTNEDVSSVSFKGENSESTEATENSDDAEKISIEVIGDTEKEEDITQKSEEVQESPRIIETPREEIESKASLELKEEVDQISKDTEEHELVLGRDLPQCETLEAEAVDTSTVQEAAILKTLETDINEIEAVHSAVGGAEESQETKDESQEREESVEVKSKETVQDVISEEKDVNLLDVPSGESEKFQDNEPATSLVSKTESQEKSEEIPSDLALKDELKDEKTKADQVDETQTMEVQRGLDLNEPEAKQIDQNRTDETEESPVEELVEVEGAGLDENTHNQTLLDVKSVEKVQKPSLETPSEILEETSKTVDEKIKDKPKEEVLLHQEGQEEGFYGLETKEETVSVPEESCLLNEQENETKLQEKNEPKKEEVSNDQQSPAEETSDEVIQVSSASASQEREDETVVEADKIEDKKVDEEEQVAEKIQKSLETVETHGTVSKKTDDEKVKDAEPKGDMSERGFEIAEATDLSLPSADQEKDIKAFDEEIQIPFVAFPLDGQEKVTSTEKEETKANETAEAKKGDEEITVSTSRATENVCIQQEEFGKLEASKLEESKEDKSQEIAENIKAIEATSDQTLPIETSDADKTPSSELVSEEKDQTPKQVEEIIEEETKEAHKLQSEDTLPTEIIPRESSDESLVSMLVSKEDECANDVSETKNTQEELSFPVDTEEHELVLGRDLPQCETLEAEAVDTSTVQEAAILKTFEIDINETEPVHSAMGGAEESQEKKDDTEVKGESQGREESVEVKSKETVQDVISEEKDVNLLDVPSGESEKFQDNEPATSLVSKTESQEKSEEIPLDLALKDELKDEKTKADQVDETQTMEVQRGLDLNEPEAKQIDQNRTDETEESPVEELVEVEGAGLDETTHNQTLLNVKSVEKVQKPSLETPSEILEETSKTVDEKIKDKSKEEVLLHQEGQEEGSYGLETKEETVLVPEESCLLNEQENETKLQEKNEPKKEEVSNDQQSPAEETSDEVIQVSSASASQEREDETVVEADKIEDKKVDEEEQVAEKIQKSLETVETHGTVSKKTDDEKVKDAEPKGDMSERGFEIAEATDLSLPSADQEKDIKAFDEEIQIPFVAFPLDGQEKVTSTEKEETKANETAEAKKGDEEITVSTSRATENVCIQQEEFGKLEASKLEESKEDKSQEIAENIKAIEATSDQTLPIETSDADKTPSSELVSEEKDQTPKQVEEIIEEETKEAHKLQYEDTLPTEIIPRESSDESLVSMLVSKEDECANDVSETKNTQEKLSFPVETEESVGDTKPKEPEDEHVETPSSPIILEKNDNETLIAEAKKEDEDINKTETTTSLDTSGTSSTSENVCYKEEELRNYEAPKVEESKEEKCQETPETIQALEATGDQTLPIETSQVHQTLPSELVTGLDDQTPRKFEEIHEEESKEERKFEATCDQSLLVETSQECQTPSSDLASGLDDQTPKQVEEIHGEETKEEQKVEVAVDQILPVETSDADQTPSLVSEILEEEKKVQAEDTVPRESFSEAPVSMLASGEDEPVTPEEGNYAGDDTHEERHVSAETEERVGETKAKEPEAEGAEKSNDQAETSTKLTDVEDENTKKTDIEVAELTDYSTGEAEHEDDNSSNLPVVEILKGLHNTLETESAINDSAPSGENVTIEPAEKVLKIGDSEVESNEKDCASDIIEEINLQEEHKEEVKVQDSISRALEVNVEEKLQEETREIAECKEEVPADLSLTEVLPVVKILIPSSPLPSEELEHVISSEKQEERKLQQDVNAIISEKISPQEEHPRDFETSKMEQKKEETHETVKEEDQIVDNKEEKKSEEEQDEKLWDSSATRDIEEIFSLEVKEDKEVHSVLGSEEEINEVVTSEKQITDPVGVITKARETEYEQNEEHIETQEAPKDQEEVSADKSLTKEALDEQNQVTSSALLDDKDVSVKKPSELIQPHQSPNQVEETSFEAKKAEEDKNEETGDALIINEYVQVQDQPKDFEASAEDKQISEQEQKSNDLKEDNGTNVKLEVHDDEIRGDGYDSVVAPKEETGLIEEKREVENVKTELEDAIKHGVSVEEKNNTSEKIGHEATKEICQEGSKQTDTLTAIKEEIREEEELSGGSKEMPAEKKLEETMFLQKETNPECPKSMKNTDDAIENSQPVTREIESLSSASNTQDKPEQKDEVPNQQRREIADEVPKIAEELQKYDEESENKKDLFSEVKESEPTEKEPARKSLSDLIQKVKGTNKNEDATTEPHIEEEPKTEEEENEDGDHEHNKDAKASPDSLVMVEAKDTVSIIKTHKKSQGILSGVGSKVKHSISKVKKVLTGKSSHTTKPSSPK